LENEFGRYGIPQKWRKWIWLGTISILLYIIKWLAAENHKLERKLDDCNGRNVSLQGETVRMQQRRADGDSALIRILLQRAFDDASKRIIEPKLDSISNVNL
jgi:hypothetical protein